MKSDQDYMRDIAEIRSMMERSSKFLSLSGWAGIMAGIYALVGAYVAHAVLDFKPVEIYDGIGVGDNTFSSLNDVVLLAVVLLILAIGTAVVFSRKRAKQKGENLWNNTSRRLLIHMAVPLVTGGTLILVFLSKGYTGILAPCTLIFYGLALYNAGKFTYQEVKSLGLIQIVLGLVSAYFIGYGLLFWAVGFGVVHIIYGVYMHFKYER